MHLFCKCCKKEDKETPAQVKRLQDEVDCLHFEMTTLSNRLSVLISEKAEDSSEVHGEFIQDTTEALLDITGRVERLELLRDETSSRQSQEKASSAAKTYGIWHPGWTAMRSARSGWSAG
ncbi:unnamed protein product [Effrenium voratum]|uniref:Uncharacterized protein n=1 Tax=Effrenium voratum TaxID=2562239 RepID=A0AA36MUT3_9DINO|nr:unnamed protein product [Effrenium voratum]